MVAEAKELYAGNFQRAVPRIMTWVGANFPTYHQIFIFLDVPDNLQREKEMENVRGRKGTNCKGEANFQEFWAKNLLDVPQGSKDWK
jgi:hypothetical protein